jgi:hypothetical protein
MFREVKTMFIDFSSPSSSVYCTRLIPNDFEKLLIG